MLSYKSQKFQIEYFGDFLKTKKHF